MRIAKCYPRAPVVRVAGKGYLPVPIRLTIEVGVLALLEIVAAPLSGPAIEGMSVMPY